MRPGRSTCRSATPSARLWPPSTTAPARSARCEEQIKQLSTTELAELRDWLLEQDSAEWDTQLERDAASGKLDKLFANARADHAAGKSTEL